MISLLYHHCFLCRNAAQTSQNVTFSLRHVLCVICRQPSMTINFVTLLPAACMCAMCDGICRQVNAIIQNTQKYHCRQPCVALLTMSRMTHLPALSPMVSAPSCSLWAAHCVPCATPRTVPLATSLAVSSVTATVSPTTWPRLSALSCTVSAT